MKIILFALLGSCFIETLNARLIEKNTDRTLTTESKTTGSSPPIRLTRDVFEEDILTGFSKEDNLQSDEFVRSYNRKARHFFQAKSTGGDATAGARVVRESSEKTEKTTKNTSTTTITSVKPKPSLVKKPIPKYNEMDYDDDFQMKISRSPVRVIDSGEHEDEDFNLDDYDFDVNHDEFIGRGKPLEPRTKHKELQDPFSHPSGKSEPKSPPTPPEVKTQSKLVSPSAHRLSNKKERAAVAPPKQKSEKDDYYDDTSSTKAPEKTKNRDQDDDLNDDNEESKEFEGKSSVSSVRMARSPWKINTYVDKLGEKTSSVMSKVLSILPMFPQVPDKNRADELISGRLEPGTGKRIH